MGSGWGVPWSEAEPKLPAVCCQRAPMRSVLISNPLCSADKQLYIERKYIARSFLKSLPLSGLTASQVGDIRILTELIFIIAAILYGRHYWAAARSQRHCALLQGNNVKNGTNSEKMIFITDRSNNFH